MRSAWFKNPCHPKTYLSSKFRRIIRENRRNEPRQILGSVFLIFIVFIIFYRFSLKNSEILCYVNLDPQKKEISYCGDFSFELFFQEVDKEHVGFVDFQNLNEFFKTNMYYPYEEEIISILRRMDKNDDGRLASSELQVGFKPLSPKEFKTNNLKSLYSTPLEKNSASKNITSASKNVKNSSINYQSSNKKPLMIIMAIIHKSLKREVSIDPRFPQRKTRKKTRIPIRKSRRNTRNTTLLRIKPQIFQIFLRVKVS